MSQTEPQPRGGGPPAIPFLGHLPFFLFDKLGFLSRCAASYGKVVRLKIGRATYLLNDDEDVGHVLVKNHSNYHKTPRLTSARGQRLAGKGLLTRSDQRHLRQRRMMAPAFHHGAIARFAEGIVEGAERMLDQWTPGSRLNVADEMMRQTQWTMGKALFGLDYSREGKKLAEAIVTRRKYIQHVFGSLLPFPEYWPTPLNFRYRRALKRIDHAIYSQIEARHETDAPPDDLLSMLVGLKYQDGSTMNDKQVRDEALTLLITGYETMGAALTWTWYLIAQHPEVERKLWAELQDVLEGRRPTIDDLPELTYAEQIFSESMRLYPPTWIFVRIAKQSDVLPSGAAIPAGAKMYLCPYVVHRNPRYFPEPDRFDPERFSSASKRNRPKHAYFPFGSGPRVCIGKHFAKMEGVLLLATVAQRFQLKMASEQTIVPEPGVILHPRDGLMMYLHRR